MNKLLLAGALAVVGCHPVDRPELLSASNSKAAERAVVQQLSSLREFTAEAVMGLYSDIAYVDVRHGECRDDRYSKYMTYCNAPVGGSYGWALGDIDDKALRSIDSLESCVSFETVDLPDQCSASEVTNIVRHPYRAHLSSEGSSHPEMFSLMMVEETGAQSALGWNCTAKGTYLDVDTFLGQGYYLERIVHTCPSPAPLVEENPRIYDTFVIKGVDLWDKDSFVLFPLLQDEWSDGVKVYGGPNSAYGLVVTDGNRVRRHTLVGVEDFIAETFDFVSDKIAEAAVASERMKQGE